MALVVSNLRIDTSIVRESSGNIIGRGTTSDGKKVDCSPKSSACSPAFHTPSRGSKSSGKKPEAEGSNNNDIYARKQSPNSHASENSASLSSFHDSDQALQTSQGREELYKTELCSSWTRSGQCRYGDKCRFAHGKCELKARLRHPRFRTEPCRNYSAQGSCPYGDRCDYLHVYAEGDKVKSAHDSNHNNVPRVSAASATAATATAATTTLSIASPNVPVLSSVNDPQNATLSINPSNGRLSRFGPSLNGTNPCHVPYSFSILWNAFKLLEAYHHDHRITSTHHLVYSIHSVPYQWDRNLVIPSLLLQLTHSSLWLKILKKFANDPHQYKHGVSLSPAEEGYTPSA